VSTADLAVIGMALVSLASIGRDFKLHMKVADRLRLVNPPKEQPQQDAAAQPQPVSISDRKAGAA
jgi:hypothetical protein